VFSPVSRKLIASRLLSALRLPISRVLLLAGIGGAEDRNVLVRGGSFFGADAKIGFFPGSNLASSFVEKALVVALAH